MVDDAVSGVEAPIAVSRRTVVRAVAWASPVVAVTAAVPESAASVELADVDVAVTNFEFSRGIGEISSVLLAGEPFTAQFSVTNYGDAAVAAGRLTVTLSAPVQFFGAGAPVIVGGAGWSVARHGAQIVATYGPSLAGGSVSSLLILEFFRPARGDAHVDASGTVTYFQTTARADAAGHIDTDPSNNQQSRSLLFPYTAELDLVRTSFSPPPGSLIDSVWKAHAFGFTLRVDNHGPAAAPSGSFRVHITAPVAYFGDAPNAFQSERPGGGLGANGGSDDPSAWTHYRSGEEYVVYWNGDLPAGRSRSFYIQFRRPNNDTPGRELGHGFAAARIVLDGIVGPYGAVGGSVGELPVVWTSW